MLASFFDLIKQKVTRAIPLLYMVSHVLASHVVGVLRAYY